MNSELIEMIQVSKPLNAYRTSPLFGRVVAQNGYFEAYSTFTRVAARMTR
jgi:hypothetical protein